jgi:hypothetical protein
MALFSRQPKNRRRRSRKKTEASPWETPPSTKTAGKGKAAKRSRKEGDYVEKVYELNAQIGAIENFLAGKNAARALAERMKRDGVLPPPDRDETPRVASRRPALSHAERRRLHAERSRSGIRFLFLFCLACGLAWWLIFSGV